MINIIRNKTREKMVSAITNYAKILKAQRKDVQIIFHIRQELVENLLAQGLIPKEAVPEKVFDGEGKEVPSVAAAAAFKICYDFREEFSEEHLILLRSAGKKLIEDQTKDLEVNINDLLGKKKVGKVYLDLTMGKEGQLSQSFITMAMILLCQKNRIKYEDIKVFVASYSEDLNDHDCLRMYLYDKNECIKYGLNKYEQELKDSGQVVRPDVISLDDFFSEDAVMEFSEFHQTGKIPV